ncbi:MAG: corrinoid protein [Christensenellales bacterium]|jgi:corrinoid protein of di/trimethylamine methyltransferase
MSIIDDINEKMQAGRVKVVKELVSQALEEGIPAEQILNDGLMAAMAVVGAKFKENEVFVPEVLVAARAMNAGIELLKPSLQASNHKAKGVAIIGTVKGDLHDIGKNLVKMMIESVGIEVIDLGTDVDKNQFLDAAIANDADLVCCSALLTTTMGEMKAVVDLFVEKDMRDKVKIMVGGAPVSQSFCDSIGADCYTVDASSAAEKALEFVS